MRALALLLFLLSSGSVAAEDSPQARSRSLALATGAKDAAAVMEHWSADGTVHMEGAEPIRGRAAIEAMYTKWFPSMVSFWTETAASGVSGGLAYETGMQRTILTDLKQTRAKYLAVWRREADEQWRLVALSISSAP